VPVSLGLAKLFSDQIVFPPSNVFLVYVHNTYYFEEFGHCYSIPSNSPDLFVGSQC